MLVLVASILGIEITASLWVLFSFSGVAFVYLKIRNEMPGEGVKKGLRYGTAIALLWLFAMLEGVSLFGNSIINEFVVGKFIIKKTKSKENIELLKGVF